MPLDEQRRQQLVDRFARRIAGLGMTAPAILFLETYKPLAFLGAQLLWVAQPFLSLGFNTADLHDLALLMEDRSGVAELIDRLESSQADGSSSPQLHQRT
jgi:hypothetical protein